MYLALVNSVSVETLKEKCINFTNLKPDWHEGCGNPISINTVREVYKLVDIAQQNGLTIMDAHTEPDGGVTLSIYYDDYMMDILVYSYEDNIMWLQKATEEVYYKESITQKDIIKNIVEFKTREMPNE